MEMRPLEAEGAVLGDVAVGVVSEPLRDICEALGVVEYEAGKGERAGKVDALLIQIAVHCVPPLEEASEDGAVKEVLVACVDDVPNAGEGYLSEGFCFEECVLACCIGLFVWIVFGLVVSACEMGVMHVLEPDRHCADAVILEVDLRVSVLLVELEALVEIPVWTAGLAKCLG